MRQWGVNNLPKVVAQQRHGRASNPRPLDRKSDALPLSHRTTPMNYKYVNIGWHGGLVVGRRTCDLRVADSRPGCDAAAQQP